MLCCHIEPLRSVRILWNALVSNFSLKTVIVFALRSLTLCFFILNISPVKFSNILRLLIYDKLATAFVGTFENYIHIVRSILKDI